MWNKATLASIEIMCIDLPVGTEEDHEKTWDSLLPVQDSNLGSPEQ
jgi:hypothetical protein